MIVVCTLVVLSASAGARQLGRAQVGYCVPVQGLEAAKAAGFDYVELGATAVAALSDAEFEVALEHARQVGLPTPNANLFLPGTIRLTGPEPTDVEQQMLYVTPGPGVNLEPYLNRVVSLSGSVIYRGDLKKDYMTVNAVIPAQ